MQNGKNMLASALAALLCISLMGAPALAAEQASAAAATSASAAETAYERASIEDAIEFVYIDQAVLSLGDEQSIAVGIAGDPLVSSATLVLSRPGSDARLEFEATALAEGAALFTFSFEAETDLAVCELDSLSYVVAGETTVVAFGKEQVSQAAVTDEGEAVAIGAVAGEEKPHAFEVVQSASAEVLETAAVSNDGTVAYAIDDEEADLVAHASVQEALASADGDGQVAADYHAALEAQQETDAQASGSLLAQAVSLLVPEKVFAAGSGAIVIGLDPGHGGKDSGATGYGLLEKDVNWKIAIACQAELNTYQNVKVVLSRSENECPGLAERVDRLIAAGAQVVVSIHNNASGSGNGRGCEVWVPNTSTYKYQETHVVGEQLGKKIVNKLAALGLTNRGVKTRDAVTEGYDFEDTHYDDGSLADYYTVIDTARRNGIPGIIVEHAFIDNADDAAFLASDENLTKLGIADASGIAAQYGLVKAEDQQFMIMGPSQTTVAQMSGWYNSQSISYPKATYGKYGAATINEFCRILYEEATAEGVRAEVVFAQAMLETGWLQFGGDVDPDQCNFCGLGATGGGNPGHSFNDNGSDSVRMGLRAQVQHLKAYASKDDLNNECIDPRFGYVTRGCAPKIDDLGGHWAPSASYGVNVRTLAESLLAFESAEPILKLTLAKTDIGNVQSIYVDGIEYAVSWKNGSATIDLPDANRRVLQVYEFNTSDQSDPYKVYPTHMRVWFLEHGAKGYTAVRASQFDDIMKYAGSSIRITGKKGIRMITAVPTKTKKTLVDAGIDGYSLREYGTVVAWDSKLDGASLVLGGAGAVSNYAYKYGVADPVFKYDGDSTQYTNVLVGFSLEQCAQSMTMRSYMKLLDSAGQEVVLYGGPVHRSIGYIAYQNKNAFGTKTEAYAYIWDIIHAVYGADAK